MKKKTRIQKAGLGSGSFFLCMTSEERDVLQKLRWKKKDSTYIPRQAIPMV
jgi:hypothetical protein